MNREDQGEPGISLFLPNLILLPDETTGSCCCCLQLGRAVLALSMKTLLNFIQCSVSLVGNMIGVGSFLFK